MEWKPIETAPKSVHGRSIWLGDVNGGMIPCWWNGREWIATYQDAPISLMRDFEPTHWQPLPEPPEGISDRPNAKVRAEE
jgi:Protein of unknown function (DUF551)